MADHDRGGLLVLAGAGSGKTRCIVSRAENLVNNGLDPTRMLCITFTNKAAGEMRDRLSQSLGRPQEDFQVYTFHGFCNKWLREEGKEIGLARYRIIDPDEVKGVIWDIAKKEQVGGWVKTQWMKKQRLSLKTPIAQLEAEYLDYENSKFKQKKINFIQNALTILTSNPDISYAGAAKLTGETPDSIKFIEVVLDAYYRQKEKQKMLDFDDLELKGIELFESIDVSTNYDYVMVDEIQDSSLTDLKLLSLVARHKNIVAVGDGKQAIYGFRGSSASNLTNFIQEFDADIHYLTSNFRSDSAIVELANDSMSNHPDKDMVSESKAAGFAGYVEFKTQKEEIDWLLDSIKSLTV